MAKKKRQRVYMYMLCVLIYIFRFHVIAICYFTYVILRPSYTQYSIMIYTGEESKRQWVYMYMYY